MRALVRTVTVLSVAAVLSAAPARAGLKSFKGPLVQDRPATVSIEHTGIKITGYQFLRPLRSVEKLFKDDTPVMKLTVVSQKDENQDVSFAVALYDDTGNLVAVASESCKLKPGETQEVELTFDNLNRYAKHASTIQVSVETHL